MKRSQEARYRAEISRLKRENLHLRNLNQAALEQATVDPLTGLKNRRYLNDESIMKIREMRISQHTDVALLMIDIDHFKQVNDTYGHHIGDVVLKQFAELLKSCTRGSDIVIRWGGEEFLIICKETSRRYISQLATRILEHSRGHVYRTQKADIKCTCSIGFICFDREVPKWKKFIEIADVNLYIAKNTGRDKAAGTIHQEGGDILIVLDNTSSEIQL